VNTQAYSVNSPLALLGRVLIGLLFFIAGVRKILGFSGTVGYFSSLGFPLPEVVTVLVILLEVGGPILFVLGWQLRPLSILLAIYTVLTAVIAHRFWAADPAQFSGQLNNFFKNISIAGAFLYVAAVAPATRITSQR
jgi:putative oxidoreductase